MVGEVLVHPPDGLSGQGLSFFLRLVLSQIFQEAGTIDVALSVREALDKTVFLAKSAGSSVKFVSCGDGGNGDGLLVLLIEVLDESRGRSALKRPAFALALGERFVLNGAH